MATIPSNNSTCPNNPWLDIGWNKTMCDADRAYLTEKGIRLLTNHPELQDDDCIIHDNLLPEPFYGDLNANVYMLSGNPGYSPEDDAIRVDPERRKLLEQLIKGNLTQNNPNVYWLDQNQPVRQACERGIYHPKKDPKRDGYDWWNDVIRELRSACGHQTPNLCNIELFPYHSKKMGNIKSLDLPSNAYVDWWIKDATRKEKWILIMRCAGDWLRRIPELVDYKNKSGKVFVGSSINITLSQNNLKRKIDMEKSEWDELVNACR